MTNQQLFNEYFRYDPQTGKIYWKTSKGNKRKGKEAGSLLSTKWIHSERRRTRVDNRKWYTAQIIWIMHHGDIPEGFFIDHINGVATDDRIENLRLATPEQNARNRNLSKSNTSGVTGVSYKKAAGKWVATIHKGRGKFIHIGLYEDKEHAVIARKAAEKVLGYTCREGEVR